MIDPKSRTLEWILESCNINKVSDPTLEDGEKEYSVEIAEIRDGKVNVMYRYSIDGSDQLDSYFEPELLTLKLKD